VYFVTLCGAKEESVVEARIGTLDREGEVVPPIPTPVSAAQAARAVPPAAVARSPRSTVRLRMVTILIGFPVITL
jgi:hypothetical protein